MDDEGTMQKDWAASCPLLEYSVVANNIMVQMANRSVFHKYDEILKRIEKARYGV